MKISITFEDFNHQLEKIQDRYEVYAPVRIEFAGTFSDTDSIRYKKINDINEVEFDYKSDFSAKELILPMTQTLFYFTEDEYIKPRVESKKKLVLLRSCDIHAMKRVDEIYLRNGEQDIYYKELRENVKFVLIGCKESFRNCFCVSMGSNKTDQYAMGIKVNNSELYLDIKDEELKEIFKGEEIDFEIDFVTENDQNIKIPENISIEVMEDDFWREYDKRCVACGKCNFVCPTCTCFNMQDIFYKDNEKNGERRRVWDSCHIEGYTDMAGGHGFRKKHGQKMRFKTMHKIYDFEKKFGYHMCIGCGRCDDACPEYISFSNCINKLSELTKEVK